MCLCLFFFKQKTSYDLRISDWSSAVCSSALLDLFRACSSYFLSRPAAIEIGRRVEHNHNIRINEPMPKHILERIAGPNVVRVQEYVESAGRKEIVKLQRSCSGFHPPIAHKNPSLSTK